MADANWGSCANCRFFGQHGASGASEGPERKCQQPQLASFELQVTAEAGCNHFEADAELGTSEGAVARPPTEHARHTYH